MTTTLLISTALALLIFMNLNKRKTALLLIKNNKRNHRNR